MFTALRPRLGEKLGDLERPWAAGRGVSRRGRWVRNHAGTTRFEANRHCDGVILRRAKQKEWIWHRLGLPEMKDVNSDHNHCTSLLRLGLRHPPVARTQRSPPPGGGGVLPGRRSRRKRSREEELGPASVRLPKPLGIGPYLGPFCTMDRSTIHWSPYHRPRQTDQTPGDARCT